MLSYKLLRKKITLYLDTFKVSCFSFILEVVSFALVLFLILCFFGYTWKNQPHFLLVISFW